VAQQGDIVKRADGWRRQNPRRLRAGPRSGGLDRERATPRRQPATVSALAAALRCPGRRRETDAADRTGRASAAAAAGVR